MGEGGNVQNRGLIGWGKEERRGVLFEGREGSFEGKALGVKATRGRETQG